MRFNRIRLTGWSSRRNSIACDLIASETNHPTDGANDEQDRKVLYTGKTHTTSGGRDGAARSSDGRLDIQLSSPGSAGTGTNPEQLFAAGWSACFIGAMQLAARAAKVTLPADLAVDAEVDLGTAGNAYFLQARLNVSVPGPIATSRSASSMRHIRPARIRRRRAATSTSTSVSLERCIRRPDAALPNARFSFFPFEVNDEYPTDRRPSRRCFGHGCRTGVLQRIHRDACAGACRSRSCNRPATR